MPGQGGELPDDVCQTPVGDPSSSSGTGSCSVPLHTFTGTMGRSGRGMMLTLGYVNRAHSFTEGSLSIVFITQNSHWVSELIITISDIRISFVHHIKLLYLRSVKITMLS